MTLLDALGAAKEGKMEQVSVKAVWLRREGDHAVVCVETPSGQWVEIIRERLDGSFSHICEAAGIHKAQS